MTAPIMHVKDWLDKTSSVFKPRSKELQALDTAIA